METREAIEEVESPGDGRWAVGIARREGELTAVLRDVSGLDASAPLDSLSSEGLPACKQWRLIETNFAAWAQCSSDPMVRVLGLPAGPANHVVWEFELRRRTYVVPALALMRALFRPPAQVLVPLFRPQGLDGICTYVDGQVTFNRWWRAAKLQASRPSTVAPLTWMHAFPSARRMASSVYRHAVEGALGMELPHARCRMRVAGAPNGARFYVTQVWMSSVEALEEPFDFARSVGRVFSFIDRVEHDATAEEHVPAARLPTRNGETCVSDEEWTQLAPVLDTQKGSTKYDRRVMLDGVLEKVCTGRPWRDVEYSVGTYVTASRQYITWRNNGTWTRICEVIGARASAQLEHERRTKPPTGPGPSEPVCADGFRPLSDEEWAVLKATHLSSFRQRKHDLRETLNLVLERAMTGKVWSVDYYATAGLRQAARDKYFLWAKSGVLDKLVATLKEMRSVS